MLPATMPIATEKNLNEINEAITRLVSEIITLHQASVVIDLALGRRLKTLKQLLVLTQDLRKSGLQGWQDWYKDNILPATGMPLKRADELIKFVERFDAAEHIEDEQVNYLNAEAAKLLIRNYITDEVFAKVMENASRENTITADVIQRAYIAANAPDYITQFHDVGHIPTHDAFLVARLCSEDEGIKEHPLWTLRPVREYTVKFLLAAYERYVSLLNNTGAVQLCTWQQLMATNGYLEDQEGESIHVCDMSESQLREYLGFQSSMRQAMAQDSQVLNVWKMTYAGGDFEIPLALKLLLDEHARSNKQLEIQIKVKRL